MASVMLVLYISDFSSSALAPLVSALDVEPEIAYRKIHLKYSNHNKQQGRKKLTSYIKTIH